MTDTYSKVFGLREVLEIHTYSGKGLAEVAQSCTRLQRVHIVSGCPLWSLNPRNMFKHQVEVVEELNDRLCCKNCVNLES